MHCTSSFPVSPYPKAKNLLYSVCVIVPHVHFSSICFIDEENRRNKIEKGPLRKAQKN